MMFFAIACVIGAIYVYLVIEETMGKALDAIHANENDHPGSKLEKC